jgi:hypothetical protein
VQQAHGAFGEVAAVGDLPFVVRLDQHRAGQPQQGLGIREDADDVGAALTWRFSRSQRQPTPRML